MIMAGCKSDEAREFYLTLCARNNYSKRELDRQINPEVSSCMYAVLAGDRSIPESLREGLQLMGKSLGKFDLEGQLRGLESVK